MKILVCVKSVPDSLAESGGRFHVNEYDLCAMEEAARIKERLGNVAITAVTVGPPRAEAELRKAMSLGADHGFLIDDSNQPGLDAFQTGSALADFARAAGFDLILCGVMSEDREQAMTGPLLAELLHLPCATTVIALGLSDDLKTATGERELAGGKREVIALPLPAVLTIQSGINVPRYASLSNVLRVKQAKVPVIPVKELSVPAARVRVQRTYPAEKSSHCEFLEGGLSEIAEQLIERLSGPVFRGDA